MRDAFHFDTLHWPWPIAVYLFLVGMSAGLVIISIILKYNAPDKGGTQDRVTKFAAILAPIAIMVGLLILVIDLTHPFRFWKLMLNFNFTSIMSLGVILLVIYSSMLFVWILLAYRDAFLTWANAPDSLQGIKSLLKCAIGLVSKLEKCIDMLLVFLAVLAGCYTGFLLSALKTFPMLNNPVLPVLFLVSGLSSGIAASMIAIGISKKGPAHDGAMTLMHKVERIVVFAEMFVLFAFMIGMLLGRGQSVVALETALSGFWGTIFWVGIVGLGMLLPLILNRICPASLKERGGFMATMALCTIIGVFLLRLFVLYTGQMTVA